MKIVRTRRYLRDLRRMDVSEEEALALEGAIASEPTIGTLIPGLRGIRKVRFGFRGRRKSGGGRAIYFIVVSAETIVMVYAYAKNKREDLSPEQRKEAVAIMKEFTDG